MPNLREFINDKRRLRYIVYLIGVYVNIILFSLHYLFIIRAHLQVFFRRWAKCRMPACNKSVGNIPLNGRLAERK